ncbi:MAG: hypothetical protein HQM10_17950 [Candidatus Riflebacteria bacterium]|nr:hypothetical protein [Candidatus Riflebacteria bacterium]
MYASIVLITRKTAIEELSALFNTKAQAKFCLDQFDLQMGETKPRSFHRYNIQHDNYQSSLDGLLKRLPAGMKYQLIDRSFLSNFTFSPDQLIVTLGQDGLVVNTAKYLHDQPILAFNPDPENIDGVLLPFETSRAEWYFELALSNSLPVKDICMAKAELSDGQTLHAFNDLFIGMKNHTSARYRIQLGEKSEDQCSSGVIVSTGAGSTGWLQSIVNGSFHIVNFFENKSGKRNSHRSGANSEGMTCKFDWSDEMLYFSVREPFKSRTSQIGITFGQVEGKDRMKITSQMSENGVIFSDGMESDFLTFNAGMTASIGVSEKKAKIFLNPLSGLFRKENNHER